MTPLEVAIGGGVAGAVGALALTPVIRLSRVAMRPPGGRPRPNPFAPGTILSEAPTAPPDLLALTAIFVQKVATGVFGSSLSVVEQRRLGVLWHLVYGGVWGVGYALIAASVTVPWLLLGLVYGFFVWLVGPAWLVPRMRLMLSPARSSRRVTTLVVLWHLVYGAVVALLVAVLHG